MSTRNSGQWGVLLNFCLENRSTSDKTRDFRFIPDDPEPWFSYECLALFTGQEIETVRKKCLPLPKHPLFKGFVRCSDLGKSHGEKAAK